MWVGLTDQIFGSLIEPRMILAIEILVVTEGIAGNLCERFCENLWGGFFENLWGGGGGSGWELYCLCKRKNWKEKVIQY